MKLHVIIALIVGSSLGSLATFLAMNSARNNIHSSVQVTPLPESLERDGSFEVIDPFAAGTDEVIKETDMPSTGEAKMDMTKPFQRDVCISLWYLEMSELVDNLEMRTGHKFENQVGKIYAGPVEILEEQAAFMRSYLAETEKIAAERTTDSDETKE